MQVTIYVDGSFSGSQSMVHGGIVYYADGERGMMHVTSTNPNLVEMRNVGGEVLAALAAIYFVGGAISRNGKPSNIKLVYDYKGIECWLTGTWKTNKLATQWFAGSVNELLKNMPLLTITYEHVKGHTGIEGNELADAVADYSMNFTRMNNVKVIDMDPLIKM